MAKLTFGTSENAAAPGQSEAAQQQKAQKEKMEESQANSLFSSAPAAQDAGPDYTYKKIRFHKNDEVNPYAEAQDERYAVDGRVKKLIILAIVAFLCFFLACVLPTNVFDVTRVDKSIGTLASETATQVQGFIGFVLNPNTLYGTYLLTVLVSLLAGAAMGLSGGVFQGALKNALAAPSTLGVTQGGTLGAIIFAVFFYPSSISTDFIGTVSEYDAARAQLSLGQQLMEEYGTFLCSLLGCVLIVAFVLLIAKLAGRGKITNVSMVVAGQVFASVIATVLLFARNWLYNHGDETTAVWLQKAQVSTFTGSYTVVSVLIFAIPLLLCMAFVFFNSTKLSLLAFKDEEAKSMGISTGKMRVLMVGACTVLTALVVSFCGPVGFVGFLVPHMARKLIGPDFRYLLPACALMGGILVTVVFYITNLGIPFISSGSAGTFTSLIGCIAFLVIALRGRRSSGGEWL